MKKRKKRYSYQINLRCEGELLDAMDDWLEGNSLQVTRTQLIKAAVRDYIERNPTVARSIIDSHRE